MSAFVVSKTHIDAIVTRAADHCREVYAKHERFDLRVPEERDRFGQMLWDANYKSVNHRYGDNVEPPVYRFERTRPLTAIEMLKALKCLSYQSCEVVRWEETQAYSAIQYLISATIGSLPGYEDAPWDIEDSPEMRSTYIRLSDLAKGGSK